MRWSRLGLLLLALALGCTIGATVVLGTQRGSTSAAPPTTLRPMPRARPASLVTVARIPGASGLAAIPGNPAGLLVTTHAGRVLLLDRALRLTRAIDNVGPVVNMRGGGLLDVAPAPDFVTSGRYYLLGVERGRHTLTLWERRLAAPTLRAGRAIRVVLRIPLRRHAGIARVPMAFGPDRLLWIALPEAGIAHRSGRPALAGHLLRLDPRRASFGSPNAPRVSRSRGRRLVLTAGLVAPSALCFSSDGHEFAILDGGRLYVLQTSRAVSARLGSRGARPRYQQAEAIGGASFIGEAGPDQRLLIVGAAGWPFTLFDRLGAGPPTHRPLQGASARPWALVSDSDGNPLVLGTDGVVAEVSFGGAPSPPVARIDGSAGGRGSFVTRVSAARSTGVRPLTFTWGASAGVRIVATGDSAVATSTVAGVVTLIVRDADGRRSTSAFPLPPVRRPPVQASPVVRLLSAPALAARGALVVRLSAGHAATWRVWISVAGARGRKLGVASKRSRIELASLSVRRGAGPQVFRLRIRTAVARRLARRPAAAVLGVRATVGPHRARTVRFAFRLR